MICISFFKFYLFLFSLPPFSPLPDSARARRTKRASTLSTHSPLPSLHTVCSQPLVMDDLLREEPNQPDKVDRLRNQIRVRVMNVLRHWLEDHWQDFETCPNLLYRLIKWINDVLIPSGKISMARSLQKSMVKRLENSESNSSSSLMFSKKAPTPILPKTDCELLEHDPVELARQVCLKEQKLYRNILSAGVSGPKMEQRTKKPVCPWDCGVHRGVQ